MERAKKATHNKEAALKNYYIFRSKFCGPIGEPSKIEGLVKAIEELKKKENELGLSLNSEKEENDLIFFYCKRPNAEVANLRDIQQRPIISKMDLNRLKQEFDFPEVTTENTLKTQADFEMKLDLSISNDPRSFHYEFNHQSYPISMNTKSKDNLKVFERKISKAYLDQVNDTLQRNESKKYEALEAFVRKGGILKDFTVDYFFDGEKFAKLNPFSKQESGYINGINFSLSYPPLTTYFETTSTVEEIKQKVYNTNTKLKNSFERVKGLGSLLACIKSGVNSFKNLKRLCLERNKYDRKCTSAFVSFLAGCHLEYLNLKGTTWYKVEFESIPISLKVCRYLRKVNFNNIRLISVYAKGKNFKETPPAAIDDELGAQILDALNTCAETLIEIQFAGAPKLVMGGPSQGLLAEKSMIIILDIITKFSNLLVLRLENNRFPNFSVENAIAFCNASRTLIDVSFEENTEVTIKSACYPLCVFICKNKPGTSFQTIEYGSLRELRKILDKNSRTPVVDDNKESVVKQMVNDFRNSLFADKNEEAEKMRKELEAERTRKESAERKLKMEQEEEFNKKIELARESAAQTNIINKNVIENTARSGSKLGSEIKSLPIRETNDAKGNRAQAIEPKQMKIKSKNKSQETAIYESVEKNAEGSKLIDNDIFSSD